MSTRQAQTPSTRRIVTGRRNQPRSETRPPKDPQLEAALQRELDTEPLTLDDSGPAVQAWARQLGLQGTALLTTFEAAPLLRICERSVRQGIKDGQIPHVRLGRRLFIPVPRLLAMLLDERESQG